MWDYVVKPSKKKSAGELDPTPLITANHPAEGDIPAAQQQLAAWAARGQQPGQAQGGEERNSEDSFGVMNLYDLLRDPSKNIRTETQLWRYAAAQDDSGNRKLLKFLMTRRDLPLLLSKTVMAQTAAGKARREAMTRMQILEEARTKPCSCPQHRCLAGNPLPVGTWAAMATEVVEANGYRDHELEEQIMNALERGRGKMRTVWIIGDRNRAKTFILEGVVALYIYFEPPDTGSYQLADLAGHEVLFLNEFAWTKEFCPWNKFKELHEGKSIKVGVPKNDGTNNKNYVYKDKAPIFGTSTRKLCLVRGGRVDEHETGQMDTRVTYFPFHVYYDPLGSPDVPPCARCVAGWLLHARDALRGRPLRRLPGAPEEATGSGRLSEEGRNSGETPHEAAAPRRSTAGQGGWYLQQNKGTYREEDLPGRCFKCGDEGHRAEECDVDTDAARGSTHGVSGRPSTNSDGHPRPQDPFCGSCGGRRSATPFCPQTGQPHHG